MACIHVESRRICGAPKIAHELPRLGVSVHRNSVSRIMQEHGIRAKSARKWRPTTTQIGHGHGASPDLLGRDFAASGPNRKWLCDITYIPTDEGFLYLAGVMDAWSRSIVGWNISDSLQRLGGPRRAAHGGRAQEPAARARAPLGPGRAVHLPGVPRLP